MSENDYSVNTHIKRNICILHQMRVALVHDYLTHFGGAERVLEALMELFPNAPVYTLVYDRSNTALPVDSSRVRTSFLQKLPGAARAHRYWPLALMPLAAEQFDFSDFDIVISTSHSFSKGIIVGPNTLHISYCFTPTRYAWDDSHKYVREFSRSPMFQKVAPFALSYIRLWDYYASQRPHVYVTLSHYVARRIAKYYRRPSHVVPPPVDIKRFAVQPKNDGYYLVVSRLVPYKRVDIAIRACETLGRRLLIAGTGPELTSLQRMAGPLTQFLGFVPDEKLPELYAGARALLFPQEEDFGITPLEAAASGKPTVALNAGGAVETIRNGITGVFFDEQTDAAMRQGILQLERKRWDALAIRRHASVYDRSAFLHRMGELVHNEWILHKQRIYANG